MNVEFPISIALIGAPGSGKQAVADEFEKLTVDFFKEKNSTLRQIENSGNVIERDYDQAMGLFGGPSENLHAFFNRFEREENARKQGVSFISLGTVVENLGHAGVGLENVMTGLQTPDAQDRMQHGQLVMGSLTYLLRERLRYNFVFYLPHPGQTLVLPGQTDTEGNYNTRVDMALRAIFANFDLRIQALDQPTAEEKAAEMLETINYILNYEPEPEEDAPVDVPPVAEPTITE